ncbi:hypothetical protein [Colwellia sp. MEBiC06753]
MRQSVTCIIWLLFSIKLFIAPAVAQEVIFPGNERDDYFTQLILLALSYTPEKQYQLKFYNEDVPKLRVFSMIAEHQGIDVVAAGSTQAREKIMQPIRFPLLKGLFGWRIPLIHQSEPEKFATISSTEEFKVFSAGQLHTWSDSAVLEGNGVKVEKGASYQGLFQMLAGKRFDYFPRSIIEVDWELDKNKDLPIIKDRHVLMHYPTAYYFYVAKDNDELATDIAFGLEQALADGSFERLFQQHYGEVVNKVYQEHRQIIKLANPILPVATPISRKELWLNFAKPH